MPYNALYRSGGRERERERCDKVIIKKEKVLLRIMLKQYFENFISIFRKHFKKIFFKKPLIVIAHNSKVI